MTPFYSILRIPNDTPAAVAARHGARLARVENIKRNIVASPSASMFAWPADPREAPTTPSKPEAA